MPQVFAAGAGRVSDAGGFRPASIHTQGGTSGLDFADPAVLRGILEQSPAPTAVVEGAEAVCTFANAAFRALGVVPGAAFVPAFPTADPAALSGVLGEVRRNGQPRRHRAAAAAGRPSPGGWELDVSPLRGGDGEMASRDDDGEVSPLRDDGEEAVRALLVTAREVPAEAAGAADQQVREISHRVKNTLQLVSSLLTLQALSAKDPAMRRAFQESCGRIGTVTQAHQRIHAAGRGSLVDFSSYLREACAELESAFAAAGSGRSIVLEVDDAALPVDAVIPLALIINELVGNAAKHAYAPGAAGVVEVGLRVLPDGGRRLVVADHGRGLPPGFEIARADTLGIKVARAFAGQLKGKFRAESNEPGARFVVDLPF